MRIGFDAKRAFHNHTGLGNYSRTLIQSLSQKFPSNRYLLFNPKPSALFRTPSSCEEIRPGQIHHRCFPSMWRSRWMLQEIASRCDLFHGLSHELPFGSERLRMPKLVTIHDLIFEHYPDHYRRSDVAIYRKKFRYAAEVANCVIAISEATKRDIVELYHIPEEKVVTCYQAIAERFFTEGQVDMKKHIQRKYQLPEHYLLSVGSIIERKNLWRVCEALGSSQLTLVVVGKGGKYKLQLQDYLKQHHLEQRVFFLEDHFPSEEIHKDLPLIYQSAKMLLYPSIVEGFGLPVIEAMASGVPVITSNTSSLKEIGTDAAILIDPLSTDDIRSAIQHLEQNEDARRHCIVQGYRYAQQFKPEICAENMMNIYKRFSPNKSS